MKSYLYTFLILLVGLMILSCNKEQISLVSSLRDEKGAQYTEAQAMPGETSDHFARIDQDDPDRGVPKCIILPALPDWATASFVIDQVYLKDDIITFILSYSGGCRPHGFQLVSTALQEAHPLQVVAQVFHENNDDPCDQWVTEVRKFDLAPLKELYYELYDNACGTIRMSFVDAVSDFEITYRFCKERKIDRTD